VVGAREGSWGGHRIAIPCLAAKSFHVGADVDALAHRLHQPTNYGGWVWVQSPLTGVVPSHRTAWVSAALDHLFGACEAPGMSHLALF
jgi:hypothetical protein